jgi:hypothetical protein
MSTIEFETMMLAESPGSLERVLLVRLISEAVTRRPFVVDAGWVGQLLTLCMCTH